MAERRSDLGQLPPPRWRVVERNRRLVVIDTRTGDAADSRAVAAPAAWLPTQVQFDGAAELTTHALYDAKGPRTIRLDPGSAAALGRLKLIAIFAGFVAIVLAITWPWALLPIVFLSGRAARMQLRAAATRWLDRVEREAS